MRWRAAFITMAAWLLLLLAAPRTAHAQDADSFPTFFFYANGGYATYKSELVHSNDVATTLSYGFGIWAGSNRNIGMMLARESSTFAFALNDSSIALATSDLFLRYRLGPVYAGVGLSSAHWQVSRPDDANADGKPDEDSPAKPLFDGLGTGYGANLGLEFKLAKSSAAYCELTYATTALVQEKALADDSGTLVERGVTLGPRLGIDLGGEVELTKRGWLAANFGFKIRTYGVSVDGTSYSEAHNSTYVGLRLSLK